MTSEGIKQKTVVEQVMEEIKSLIAKGRHKPNGRIPTESQLAEKHGIGRSPVREAIKIFQFEMVDLRTTIEHAGLIQIVTDLERDPASAAPRLAGLKSALLRLENGNPSAGLAALSPGLSRAPSSRNYCGQIKVFSLYLT